ncbi:MAG TPA: phosphotransferase [Terriglobales bacterium]|jgi:predicted trehalose synthase
MMQVAAKVEPWANIPAASKAQLAAQLGTWLPHQRWFAGKGATITAIKIADTAVLGPETGWLLAEVATAGPEPPAMYQLMVSTPAGGAALGGMNVAAVRARWFQRLAETAVVPTAHGELQFELFPPGLAASGEKWPATSRVGSAEQSNTSILFADGEGTTRWVLKLFRHLLPGENPEFEIPRALAEHTSFRHVPAALGRVLYRTGSDEYTIATLQEFIPNDGDGWTYVLRQLAAGADIRADLARLGGRTAELHQALASIAAPAFRPQPIDAAGLEHWRRRALAGAEDVRLGSYRDQLARWRARLADLDTCGLAGLEGCAQIRIHGDYHLGQVLKTAVARHFSLGRSRGSLEGGLRLTAADARSARGISKLPPDDFFIFDFEGEPARPLSERRRRGCVLQDVAGMLRSLSYAAHAAGQPAWEAGARKSFLDSYLETMRGQGAGGPAGLLPAQVAPALAFFELEKAVYELRYELAHRPDWVAVPLAGLAALLLPS